MKIYDGQNIRNVALVGHGDTGKTQLISALLYAAGMVNRLGKVDDGTSVTDYDEEEIQRKFSISAALAYAEWGKTKINFIDTPGYNIFLHETEAALLAADSALVLVHGVSGVEVQTEKTWGFCEKYGLPRAIVVNQMDRDRASLERALAALQEAFGRAVIPIQLPVGEEKSFRGVIDLVTMKARLYDGSGSGKGKESEIPAELADAAGKAHEALVEMVAEGNDKLLEEFFDKGTIPPEDLIPGLKQAVGEKRIVPVLVSAGLPNIGAEDLLNFIADYLPSPLERGEVEGLDHEGGSPVKRKVADDQPVSAYVFKTVADPFAGRVSYFKVMSGVVKNDATLTNIERGGTEKLAHIGVVQGKTQTPVPELHAGDIGAVAKLKETLTGDTLGDKSAPIVYPKVKLAEPAISLCGRGQVARRRGQALHRHPSHVGRRPAAALLARRADQGVPGFRRRPAARGGGGLQAQAALQCGSDAESAEDSLPRDHSRQGRRAGQAQEADGRPRPVRRLLDQDGTAGARQRLRVCQRHLRRLHSQELHPGGRKGHRRSSGQRLPGRLSGGGLPGDPVRRLLSRSRFFGNGVQAGGLQGLQEVYGASQALPARAHYERRDHRSGELCRRYYGESEWPARARAGHGSQGRLDVDQGPGAASPTCSPTPPTSPP